MYDRVAPRGDGLDFLFYVLSLGILHIMRRVSAGLRKHYEVERELGRKLRSATREERRSLYGALYDERLRQVPDHPLLIKAKGGSVAARDLRNQLGIIRPFLRRDSVFLEVGPGDCRLALEIAPLVRKVYAADVSAGLLPHDPSKLRIDFIQFDGIEIPVEPNSVDVVFSAQVLEHLHSEDAFLQLSSIRTALSDGGVFICITPNRLSGPWDVSRHFTEEPTGLHLKEYTVGELVELLENVGFSSVTAMATWHGHVLLRRVPVAPIRAVEGLLERLPRVVRRRIGRLMTLFKVVAVK